jgi:predicted RNase H-like HicB family nuclease
MKTIHIRAVLFHESGWWCGQCLEHDVATQARTIADLKAELIQAISIHADLAIERGHEPLAGLPKAPDRYFQMYDAFAKLGGTEEASPITTSYLDAQACILAHFAYPEMTSAHH